MMQSMQQRYFFSLAQLEPTAQVAGKKSMNRIVFATII